MSKITGYQFNFDVVPPGINVVDVWEALAIFILAVQYEFGGISEDTFLRLPDDMKKYYKPIVKKEAEK